MFFNNRLITIALFSGILVVLIGFALIWSADQSEIAGEAALESNDDAAERIAQRRSSADPLALPASERTVAGTDMANMFGERYWYLPYAVANEEQGLAFAEAYSALLEETGMPEALPDTLDVPEGKGAGGTDKLYRLQAGLTDFFISDPNASAVSAVSTSEIPVIIAQPGPDAESANVLFMDGHVELVRKGEFPLTEPFLNALRKLDPPEYADRG